MIQVMGLLWTGSTLQQICLKILSKLSANNLFVISSSFLAVVKVTPLKSTVLTISFDFADLKRIHTAGSSSLARIPSVVRTGFVSVDWNVCKVCDEVMVESEIARFFIPANRHNSLGHPVLFLCYRKIWTVEGFFETSLICLD